MFISNHLVGFGAASAAVVETISTMGEAHSAFNTNTLVNYALRFTPTFGGTVTGAELSGSDFGNPAVNWVARIYTDNSGSPGSTVGSASNNTAEATHPATHTFTWGSPPAVSAGTPYWIVYSRSTSTNKMSLCGAIAGVMTGGHSTIASIADGSNINASSDVRCSVTVTP